MHWATDLHLKLLGVGEVFENAAAVVEDWWLKGRRRPSAGLHGAVSGWVVGDPASAISGGRAC